MIHGVAHPDANIIFGAVIDDELGDEVRVTVIAAGFDRWDDGGSGASSEGAPPRTSDLFAPLDDEDGDDGGDDEFDVPSFLK